jgi:hypothetical protein
MPKIEKVVSDWTHLPTAHFSKIVSV